MPDDELTRGHVIDLQRQAWQSRGKRKGNKAARDDWPDAFLRNSRGEPAAASQRNVELILENDAAFQDLLAYDAFADQIYKTRPPPYAHRKACEQWTDPDNYAFTSWMAQRYGFEPADRALQGALVNVAGQRSFHPVLDYLHALQWDGTTRLGFWCKDALGASDDPEYLAIVGRRYLIGAVARVMNPGCKMDNVIILEGRQGRRKSTALEILFAPWFSDAPLVIGDKDSYAVTIGVWCHEMPELDAFNKAETTASKAFFSQRRIRYRPPYGRNAQDFQRQTVFAGTTNRRAYLKDDENRRYWPMFCACIDLGWLREHKDQLWAEALTAYQSEADGPHENRSESARWWIDAEEQAATTLAVQAVSQRQLGDAWEGILADYLASSTADFHTTESLLIDALKFDPAHIQPQHSNRLATTMKLIGWRPEKRWMQIGPEKKQRRGYVQETSS